MNCADAPKKGRLVDNMPDEEKPETSEKKPIPPAEAPASIPEAPTAAEQPQNVPVITLTESEAANLGAYILKLESQARQKPKVVYAGQPAPQPRRSRQNFTRAPFHAPVRAQAVIRQPQTPAIPQAPRQYPQPVRIAMPPRRTSGGLNWLFSGPQPPIRPTIGKKPKFHRKHRGEHKF